MAKQVTFKVSKPSKQLETECTWDAPESVDDPRWADVVDKPEEDVNELAVQNLIIKIQSGARDELEKNGPAAAQQYVDSYKYGARSGGGFKRPVLAASAVSGLQFTEEQIAALRAAGVKIGTPEEEMVEA